MKPDAVLPIPKMPEERLVSLDAYRGLTMLAMASGGLGLHQVANNMIKSGHDTSFWRTVQYQFEHVPWIGCAVWDLIQPSFMFMVGVAMAYSCASRAAHGQTYGQMLWHAIVRSIILISLGIFLRSDGFGRTQTNFTFEDVLTQIGLGYTFLFLLWGRPRWVQFGAAIGILVGYWCLFYFYPVPTQIDPKSGAFGLEGVAAHWDKNTNAAAAFDQWFLNLFPRKQRFIYNGGGYLTLSFIPSLATMIFGLLAGELLRSFRNRRAKFWWLVAAGVAGLVAGQLLDSAGICPNVKRIWTPSWALFSTGWACLILAAFFAVVDMFGFQAWTFPLVVVGMNSIVMYCMAELSEGWFGRTIQTHLRAPYETIRDHLQWDVFYKTFGRGEYQPFFTKLWILFAMWLVCYWLYRQKIFIRI